MPLGRGEGRIRPRIESSIASGVSSSVAEKWRVGDDSGVWSGLREIGDKRAFAVGGGVRRGERWLDIARRSVREDALVQG